MSGSNQPTQQQGAVPDTAPDLMGLPRDEQVHVLRSELTGVAWRQEVLRQDLEQLESERVVDAERTAPTG